MQTERAVGEPGRVFQINVSSGGVPKRVVLRGVIAGLGLEGDRQARGVFLLAYRPGADRCLE